MSFAVVCRVRVKGAKAIQRGPEVAGGHAERSFSVHVPLYQLHITSSSQQWREQTCISRHSASWDVVRRTKAVFPQDLVAKAGGRAPGSKTICTPPSLDLGNHAAIGHCSLLSATRCTIILEIGRYFSNAVREHVERPTPTSVIWCDRSIRDRRLSRRCHSHADLQCICGRLLAIRRL